MKEIFRMRKKQYINMNLSQTTCLFLFSRDIHKNVTQCDAMQVSLILSVLPSLNVRTNFEGRVPIISCRNKLFFTTSFELLFAHKYLVLLYISTR